MKRLLPWLAFALLISVVPVYGDSIDDILRASRELGAREALANRARSEQPNEILQILGYIVAAIVGLALIAMPFAVLRIERLLRTWTAEQQQQALASASNEHKRLEQLKIQTRLLEEVRDALATADVVRE